MLFSRTVQRVLLVVGLVALAVAIWDLTSGGFYLEVFGIRFSSREAYKPFRISGLALIAAIWLRDRTVGPERGSWQLLNRSTPWIAGAMVAMSIVLALRFGIFAAGGADAYGYVSEAALLATGQLVTSDPLVGLERALGHAVLPLGYVFGKTPGTIVPQYPPGLPLAMAPAIMIAGPQGAYFVVPILGGIAIWLTYLIGAAVDKPITGLIAAILLAFAPIFLFHTLEPMSDVPATTWWLLAWVFALSHSQWGPTSAGLAVSAALITRPNLLPLTVIVGFVVASTTPSLQRLARFVVGLLPGCLLVAAINLYLFGSPFASGYGPMQALYSFSRWPENLKNYATLLIDVNSPIVLLGFLAPFFSRVKHALAMLLFVASLLLCYVFYIVYDTWPFLRFLLPGLPLLFVLAGAVFVHGAERLPHTLRTVAVLLLCVLLPIWFVKKADRLTVFDIKRAEFRYVAVGEAIGRLLPPNAIVLSQIQSGSVRMYGQRPTIRWDILEPVHFDEAVATLRQRGYDIYLLLEDWETPLFQQRFAPSTSYGHANWPPALEYQDIVRVRVYRLDDLIQHQRGAKIETRHLAYDH